WDRGGAARNYSSRRLGLAEKKSFPAFSGPKDFSIWNEFVQRKKVFFLTSRRSYCC
uniref:Uncharacterized protein n=1 Tax=Gopherus agassizii TaxID=38772 RepID=A0A452HEW9_9SAUR